MHLMVGTPMYSGMCCSEYVSSLLSLKEAMMMNNHNLTCVFVGNESLIQRARNSLVWNFLKSDASHLLFIDADQSFRPKDIAKMITADKGIIGACVPMKGINWSRVRAGAVLNHPDLSSLTGFFNIQHLDDHKMTDPDTPFEVRVIGTGMMLIRRDVFETLSPHVEDYFNHEFNDRVKNFFEARVYNDEFLSEDYFFCQNYRDHGGQVWAAPWCEVGHFGSYLFTGQYSKGDLNGSSMH